MFKTDAFKREQKSELKKDISEAAQQQHQDRNENSLQSLLSRIDPEEIQELRERNQEEMR